MREKSGAEWRGGDGDVIEGGAGGEGAHVVVGRGLIWW